MSAPIWESALVAALVASAVSLTTLWWNSRQSRLDRQRKLFAEAYAAVAEYREFPFIIRRRDSTGMDRSTIHRDLSRVQVALHRYEAMLRVEAPTVAAAYARLVAETRRIAGAEISKAWDLPAAADDGDMHVADVDLSPLDSHESAFLAATRNQFSRWS